MYHLRIIWLFITIHFTTLCQAQDSLNYTTKKNQFQISPSLHYISTLDLQFSPNLYSSKRLGMMLGYSRFFKSGIFISSLELAAGNLLPADGQFHKVYIHKTDFAGNHTIEETELMNFQMLLEFNVGYLHKINSYSTKHIKLFIGGNLKEHLTFAPSLISIGTMNFLSLNLSCRADFLLPNKKLLTASFEFPVLSMVTRLPYHNAPAIPGKSDLAAFFTGHNELETVNQFQDIRLSVSYPIWIGKKIAFNATYKFQWIHYSIPEHVTETGSQFLLSFNF